MMLYVHRFAKRNSYTIGHLYVNGTRFCDTLEDKDRGLNQTLSEEVNKKLKVYGKTAIPMGRYPVCIHRWSKFGIDVPMLIGVKAFTGILIHNGANENNTEGCILVGENNRVGRLENGKKYMTELTNMVREAIGKGERVEIIVSDIAPQFVKGKDGKMELKKFNTLGLGLMVALLMLLTGCRGTSKVERVEVHDTVTRVNTIVDSVDRWHTHYEFMDGETIHCHDTFYLSRTLREHDTVHDVVHDVQTRDVERVVEKRVLVWWPGLVVALLSVAGVVYWYLNKKGVIKWK